MNPLAHIIVPNSTSIMNILLEFLYLRFVNLLPRIGGRPFQGVGVGIFFDPGSGAQP